jgi:ditrans,polycis-polyprenyl diphosphate synthase
MCLTLGIKCVSVYAFAIDNFKRPEEEVGGLMHLFETELLDLCLPGYAGLLYFPTKKRTKLLVSRAQRIVRSAQSTTEHNWQNRPLPTWGASGSGNSERSDRG